MNGFDLETAQQLVDRLDTVLRPAGLDVHGLGRVDVPPSSMSLPVSWDAFDWIIEVQTVRDLQLGRAGKTLEVWPGPGEHRYLVIDRNLLDPLEDEPVAIQAHGITEIAGEEHLAGHLAKHLRVN